jgi:hypothetical protein
MSAGGFEIRRADTGNAAVRAIMGMPEYGGRRDPCDVLLAQRDGGATVYQRYR